MKKYILLLIVLMVGVFASAQSVTLPAMPFGDTYQYIPTDYTVTNTTARTFIFFAPQHEKNTQDYVIKLDSVSGNHTAVAVVFYGGKSLIKGDWTQIGTATWTTVPKPSADTTIIISNATANRYRYFKATVTGSGSGVTKVSDQELKLWRE